MIDILSKKFADCNGLYKKDWSDIFHIEIEHHYNNDDVFILTLKVHEKEFNIPDDFIVVGIHYSSKVGNIYISFRYNE